eukprot:845037-Pelagomonas_calceolata.AAC.2
MGLLSIASSPPLPAPACLPPAAAAAAAVVVPAAGPPSSAPAQLPGRPETAAAVAAPAPLCSKPSARAQCCWHGLQSREVCWGLPAHQQQLHSFRCARMNRKEDANKRPHAFRKSPC